MSMAYSIENRVPYLDYEFVDTAMCLPESYLLHFIQDEKRQFLLGKYMLRRIAGELYGSDYIYQKKVGFPLPIKAYLQSDLFSAYVHENVFPSASQRGLLNVPVLKEWFDNLDRIDYQKAVALWKGICLESWCQIYLVFY